VACLRPETLLLDAERGVEGKVEQATYAGGSVTYRVALEGGPAVLVRAQLPDGRPPHAAGDVVHVRLEEVACRLLPR
jgi:ribosomal protein L35AE/L33A